MSRNLSDDSPATAPKRGTCRLGRSLTLQRQSRHRPQERRAGQIVVVAKGHRRRTRLQIRVAVEQVLIHACIAVADGKQAVILNQVTFGIAVRMAVMGIVAGNEA